MKRFKSFFTTTRVINLVLIMLAVLTGGASIAAAIGEEGNTPQAKTDPSDPVNPDAGTGQNPDDDPSGRLAPGDHTAGQNLDGTQASSTQMRDGGLEEDEWDQQLVEFQPYRNPILTVIRKVARNQNIQNWSIKHPRVGGETLDGYTKKQITAEGDGTIILNKDNFRGSLVSFQKGYTIMVDGVQGYASDATSANYQTRGEGDLMLFILSNDGKNVTCAAVNGIPTDDVQTDTLDSKKCPTIPADTYMCLGAAAMAESQLELPPTNYQPRYEEFYVQKKGYNILYTEDFEKTKKKTPFKIADIRADAIYKYKLQCERTYLRGVQSKFKSRTDDGAIEDVFTTKGLLYQLTNLFSYERGNLHLYDLISMAKLQLTTFSQSNEAYFFGGKDFVEEVLKLKIDDTDKTIAFENTKEFNIDFKGIKTPYGTLKFAWDEGMDATGLKDCAMILDLKGATRYVRISGHDQTNDLSKGYNARLAKREMHVEADGIALRGYNSILIQPSDRTIKTSLTSIRSKVISAAALPAAAETVDKMIIALYENYIVEGKEYKKGYAYQATKVSDSVTWAEYKGYTSVTM